MKRFLTLILCISIVLSTMGTAVFADNTTNTLPEVDVVIDSSTTWSNAIAAATDVNGDGIITYGVSGKVIVDVPQIKGPAETIYIIGQSDDAELVVECERGNITINNNAIRTVNFANITLSRLNGSWIGDLDNTNKFFTVWTYQSSATQVNYTNCVFPNGTSAAYPGATTYTDCQFNNATDFGLWVYAKGDVTVNGGSFNSYGGIKTYGYASQTEMSTVVEGADFNVTNKPAVVVSGLGTVELDNVDVEDCTYGVWEVGVVGGNTATVTLDDEEPTFVAQCQDKYGVTVYVTNADYAENVAEEANSTTNSPVDNVAKIVAQGGYATYYTSLHTAISEAQSGDVVEVLKDETYDVWNSIWNKDGITINGNNNTITVNKVDSGINGSAMLLKASNLTINDLNVVFPDAPTLERERIASMYSGSLNNVNVTGGAHGVTILGEGNVVIDDCEFSGLYDWAIETEGRSTSDNASLTISNSTFDNKAIIIRGKNTTFNDNTITETGEGVNVLGDAVITGNDFGESTLGIDQGRTVTIENNIINNVEFPNWFGVVEEDYSALAVENNTLSGEAVTAFNEKLDEEVVSVDYVATVNGKAYYSLADAVAALEEGDTLKIATGEYEGFDVLVDNVTITGMTPDTVLTITAIPGNAFIGINAEGVSVENLTFVVSEGYAQTGDWTDGFDAVIGYWSNNFNAGSNVTTGYNVEGCTFINNSTSMGAALFNFSSFEIVGNTFENFNVGIHTMSDGSAMGNVVISDNTFTKVNEPVNVYWGQTGDDDDSIAITGNNFVSAKDADEIKITIHDYASTVSGTSGIDAIDLSGNTYSAATEVELVDAATDVSSIVESTLENVENVIVDTKYSAVARIGEYKYFTSIGAAVDAAVTGDNEIVILPGTYDESFMINQAEGVNITLKAEQKGKVTLTGTISVNGSRRQSGAETLNIENIVFDGTTKTASHNFIMDSNGTPNYPTYAHNVTVKNCDFNGNNDYNNAVVAFREPKGGSNNIVFDGCTAKDMHSLIQVSSSLKITVTNCTLKNMSEGGVNGTGSKDIIFTNNDVDVKEYAVRTGQSSASTNTLSNVTMTDNEISAGVTALALRNATTTAVMTNNNIVAPSAYTNNNADDSTINGIPIVSENIVDEIKKDNTVTKPITPSYTGGGVVTYNWTVKFETNGGSEVKAIAVEKNDVAIEPAAPTKEGFEFDGWYTDKELTTAYDFSEKVTKNITLYAKWTEVEKEPETSALFKDVKETDWFYEYVMYVAENGLMNGVSEDEFAPNNTLTRAMLVTVLYRNAGQPATDKSIPFSDVDMSAYYADAVLWAKQNGIVNGITEIEFAPNSNITREQIATIIYRYAQYNGMETVTMEENLHFADADEISEYAVSAMNWAVGTGLLKGKTTTTLNPKDNATRAEIAAILQRFIENNK